MMPQYETGFWKPADIEWFRNPVKAYEKNTVLSYVHYFAAQHVESQTEGNGANWAGRLRFRVGKIRFRQ
jgi:hypothetical protein